MRRMRVPPAWQARLDRLQRTLPAQLVRRFVEIDLLTHAASLSFFALLSLAPLLVLLLWLSASLYPSAQAELMEQLGALAGRGAQEVAATVLRNAEARPDVGSLAPRLVLLVWLSASRGPPARAGLMEQLGARAGRGAQGGAAPVLRNAGARPDVGSLAGMWSTLLLFVGATAVFARLQNTLNLV